MSDPRAFWLEIERTFDHLKPAIDPALFAERGRGSYDTLGKLELRLQGQTEQHKYLVAGTIGNGKSTELYQASRRLTEHRLVVYVDLWRHFSAQVRDPSALDHLEPWELLGLLGLAIIRAGQERFGHGWEHQPKVLERALKALRDADAEGGGAEIDVVKLSQGLAVAAGGAAGTLLGGAASGVLGAGVGQVVAQAGLAALEAIGNATSWTWKLGLRGTRTTHDDQDPEVHSLRGAVTSLIMGLQETYHRRLLLVVDGLDRIEDPKRVKRIFRDSALLIGLPCDQVFTVQPFDVLKEIDKKGFEVYEHYNVPVLDRSDYRKLGSGIGFFHELVRKRLAVVSRPPPSTDPIPAPIIDRLAYYSGGVVREFVRMIAFAAGEAWRAHAVALDEAIVEEVLLDARRSKEMRINREEIKLLREVMEDPEHELPDGPMAQTLLAQHRLLLYPNDTPWYFPNPVLTLKLLKPKPLPSSTP